MILLLGRQYFCTLAYKFYGLHASFFHVTFWVVCNLQDLTAIFFGYVLLLKDPLIYTLFFGTKDFEHKNEYDTFE